MVQLARRASLVVVLLLASVGTTSAECASLPLRTYTPQERQQFETQYGAHWWKAMRLIPGPQTQADWVERPAGDSSVIAFSPQQFWDPRACASRLKPRGPKATEEAPTF
jgi:hypothetical protein